MATMSRIGNAASSAGSTGRIARWAAWAISETWAKRRSRYTRTAAIVTAAAPTRTTLRIRTECWVVPNVPFHSPDRTAAATARTAMLAVPEPGTYACLLAGLAGLLGLRRFRHLGNRGVLHRNRAAIASQLAQSKRAFFVR